MVSKYCIAFVVACLSFTVSTTHSFITIKKNLRDSTRLGYAFACPNCPKYGWVCRNCFPNSTNKAETEPLEEGFIIFLFFYC